MLSNFVSPCYRKWLPLASVLVSLPAYSMWLDTSEGLNFGLFGSVSPTLTTETNTFNYTYSDPAIFYDSDEQEALAQVLAAKDREDADRRVRLGGYDSSSLQISAHQVLTKDYSVFGSTLLEFDESNFRNYGALWGVELIARNKGSLKLGSNWAGLDVKQTRARDLLSTNGTNVHLDVTYIPNLTVSAFHMLAPPSDVRDPKNAQLIRADGASIAYEHNIAPRQSLRGAIGTVRSVGHDAPFYVGVQKGKGRDTMASLSYQYEDLKVAMDVGRSDKNYNGTFSDKLTTDVLGVQVDYEVTPRLSTTFNYSHSRSKNSKPVAFANLLAYRRGVDEGRFFNRVDSDNYRLGVRYKLYKGVSLQGAIANDRTKNFLTDGEFSRRNQTRYNAGATFSF